MAERFFAARAITADTALRLARYFGTTPQLWMNLQAQYDLQRAGADCAVDLEGIRLRLATDRAEWLGVHGVSSHLRPY